MKKISMDRFFKIFGSIIQSAFLVAMLLGVGCASSQRLSRYSPSISDRDVAVLPMRHSEISSQVFINNMDDSEVVDFSGDGAKRLLQKGDRIEIFLQGIPVPSTIKDVIDGHGKVNLPLIENVAIGGMTTYTAEKLIEKSYVDGGYYRKIEVSVVALSVVAKMDAVFVGGEVRRPGTYPLSSHLTLTRAIIAAGGYTDFARRRKIQLTHMDGKSNIHNSKRIEDGKDIDPVIKAGDVVNVHRGLL